MTSLLATIESLVKADGRRHRLSWDDLLMHRNSAPLPSPFPGADTMWNRGFDFLVLDGGAPSHFGRCRSHGDTRATRASSIRAELSADPELARLVAPTRFVVGEEHLVEVSRYVRGTPFLRDVAGLSSAALAADLRRIVAATRRVTSKAEERIPSLRLREARLELREAATDALRFLEQAGMTGDRLAALAAALGAGGAIAPHAQHGDLWPANVLRSGGGFVLLDFEVFGEIHVPLFDLFHLLRSCLMQRATHAGSLPLLTILEGNGADASTWRAIVSEEAATNGMTRDQAVGAFVYYLVEMSATLRRRGGPEGFWGPYWRCLEQLADRLRSGAALDTLLLGQRVSAA